MPLDGPPPWVQAFQRRPREDGKTQDRAPLETLEVSQAGHGRRPGSISKSPGGSCLEKCLGWSLLDISAQTAASMTHRTSLRCIDIKPPEGPVLVSVLLQFSTRGRVIRVIRVYRNN
ncbi:hypothetical protein L3Q82_010358 [Scortum barcoo]|uniref:Uncharacterized protein n=1 Tax=Scortum barcoo TaxID=214431 RepID=A0ACB8WBY1_9TELE|nr:hypothetical protein L3Q82_010358 [Scortum barcoo]